METKEKLDIVIFGASGFTGKEIIKFLVKRCENIKWGIGGRNEEKLKKVLEDLGSNYGSIPYFIADVDSPSQLCQITAQCRLLLNCVGPYQLYGEPVVRACLQTSTNYVDVTAEPQFMEKIQLLYNEEAKKKGIFIVPACGVDCVLSEMGLEYLLSNFEGSLNSVETYHQVFLPENFKLGTPLINLGTWKSLIYVMQNYKELKKIRTKLWQNKKMPELQPKLHINRLPQKKPFYKGWSAPFPNSDATVMRRSQRYFYEKFGERPIQVHNYLVVPKFWLLFVLLIFGIYILFFTSFKWGSKILIKYYKIFTLGFFDHNPDEKAKENIKFEVILHGKGWEKKVDVNYSSPTTSEIVVCVSGRDGYEATAICALACCKTLLEEKITLEGGVHTTATAFRGTNILQTLTDYGLTFSILYKAKKK